jgi:hypothetical protein
MCPATPFNSWSADAGSVCSKRRSHISHWPGCPNHDAVGAQGIRACQSAVFTIVGTTIPESACPVARELQAVRQQIQLSLPPS